MFTHFLLLFFIAAGSCLTSCNTKTTHNQEPVISITSGNVSSSFNDAVFAFKGIPYACAERYETDTDTYIALFAEAYPGYIPQNLLSVDTVFRPYTIRTADARALASDAPLYVYFLAWKSDVDDASKGSFHSLNIPLAFNTVDLRPDWTGNTEEA